MYYYHAATGQSTYTRPVAYPIAQQSIAPTAPLKKEKPLYKIPVPNSPWTRVKTNHGNIFFTRNNDNQNGSKISVWTVPDDISNLVAEMDWDALEEDAARDKEIARLQKEMQLEATSLKRKLHDETATAHGATPTTDDAATGAAIESPPKKKSRRSTVQAVPVDQAIDEIAISAPLASGEDEAIENNENDDDDAGDSEDDDAFSSTSAAEEWQREMAEGMAKLAEEEARAANGEVEPEATGEDAVDEVDAAAEKNAEKSSIPVPAQVNLSPEEARTLFKVS